MSEITAYRRYAPFTADRLIDAANSILATNGSQPMTKRTLRFYTAQNVVPRPLGSPKFARYGYEHLLTLLSARALQDQGLKLEQIVNEVAEIRRGQLNRLENLVDNWLAHTRTTPSNFVRETAAVYAVTGEDAPPAIRASHLVQRIQLTPSAVIEIASGTSIRTELEAARGAIDGLLMEAAAT